MNPKIIVFVTSNSYKLQIAKRALNGSGLKLVQKKLKVPEIQDESVEKVAAFSARWASNVLKRSVVVSDGGCYIEALKGFPGPFIKYVSRWFSAEDLLQIMRGKKNRHMVWKDCLAYCEPGKNPTTLVSYFNGKLAEKAGKNVYRKNYGWMDTLFIPQEFTKPLSELPTKEYIRFWSNNKNYDSWQVLSRYLRNRQKSKGNGCQ